jgi:hypothetical protein
MGGWEQVVEVRVAARRLESLAANSALELRHLRQQSSLYQKSGASIHVVINSINHSHSPIGATLHICNGA